MLGGVETHDAEAQFSQSKLFLTTITLLLELDLYTYPEKVLLDRNSDKMTLISGHSFEIQTSYKINPIPDQICKMFIIWQSVPKAVTLSHTFVAALL